MVGLRVERRRRAKGAIERGGRSSSAAGGGANSAIAGKKLPTRRPKRPAARREPASHASAGQVNAQLWTIDSYPYRTSQKAAVAGDLLNDINPFSFFMAEAG